MAKSSIPSKSTVLVVEDDLELLDALTTTLELNGLEYIGVDSAKDALVMLDKQAVDIVVSDINMPGMNGFELMQEILRSYPGLPVVLMTAYGQISQAVAAMQSGASDYLVKPFDSNALVHTLKKYVGEEPADLSGDAPVAADAGTKRIFQLAKRVADTDSTVLISGESGTGKEVLARFLHQHSGRSKGPFIAINCAAIPENMLEAILFGHEKGAFTGAHASMPGKFEQANGGTLLLDEISEMDLGLQAKLLRVLQEREVERIGGRKSINLDVRVLATTNRDLKEIVRDGRFREDLYYRLSVFPIHWLPLRDRAKDIVPLAQHLLAMHAAKMQVAHVQFDNSALLAMANYRWPGNVRELDNVVQRSLILQQGGVISATDLCIDGVGLENIGLGHAGLGSADLGRSTIGCATRGIAGVENTGEENTSLEAGLVDSLDSLGRGIQNLAVGHSGAEIAVGEDADIETDAGLGKEMKMREFQIILDTLRSEGGRRNKAAEKLGISPRTLRYKIARMRDCGIDVEERLAKAG